MSPSRPAYRPRAPDRLTLGDEDLRALGLSCGALRVLPILHGRLEFAWLTRQVIARLRPRAIAVELPESLEAPVRKAVARLPLLSVV
ncbi:MAG: hypothetical protein KC636_31760, partial [Myxococcales bacterium]|nr:hypothetical protein [Myxococcales bacterium]